ncbi:NRDE family protein [Microbacterium sp. IEGM 1404]|uniref:NRDE family protein n=1 Tax=Microbacterium sp. IEGM 1404 TaxID=3047084 RepID=UPI0024B70874|nr:NRDE family protein [Microbacterium sp. IEGM 1404]MDI9889744.1 NRDE family protein [Microbacterium sp. IEGM 1404]
MCTVVVDVPRESGRPVRILAVRDEDRHRPWRGLGPWWPEQPGVRGVRDDRAGGAWLAIDPAARRLAVLLNREDLSQRSDVEVVSRGGIPLQSVAGTLPQDPPTRGFNLVEVDADGATVVEWDGLAARRTRLAPGTHMIAHHAPDDRGTPRIGRWLDDFRRAGIATGDEWWGPWLDVVAASTADPSASVLRRDAHDDVVLESLLACVASVGPDGVDVREAVLSEPGEWDEALAEHLRAGAPAGPQ